MACKCAQSLVAAGCFRSGSAKKHTAAMSPGRSRCSSHSLVGPLTTLWNEVCLVLPAPASRPDPSPQICVVQLCSVPRRCIGPIRTHRSPWRGRKTTTFGVSRFACAAAVHKLLRCPMLFSGPNSGLRAFKQTAVTHKRLTLVAFPLRRSSITATKYEWVSHIWRLSAPHWHGIATASTSSCSSGRGAASKALHTSRCHRAISFLFAEPSIASPPLAGRRRSWAPCAECSDGRTSSRLQY